MTPRTEQCFRVWLRSRFDRQHTPIIQAADIAGVRDKVEQLYPGAELLEITPLHAADDAEHRGVLGYRILRAKAGRPDRRTVDRRAVPA